MTDSKPDETTPRRDRLPLEIELLILTILDLGDAERADAEAQFAIDHPKWIDALATYAQRTPGSAASNRRLDRLRARAGEHDDRYQIDREIARGGMGVIFCARDDDLGRALAIKKLRAQIDPEEHEDPRVSADALDRFIEEAQVTGQLDHPGVVPVHELGIDPQGRAYFTMRLVRGRTASEVFELARRGAEGWTFTRAIDVVLKACDTLAFAHSKGVVHRDIKPANIMVGRFGEVYVMDWGLARVLGRPDRRDLRIRPRQSVSQSRVRTDRSREVESDPDSPLVTMEGAVVGTPCFMSPEQAEGRIELIDLRTDVYALGAVLYALLTGTPPYLKPAQQASPYTILRWVCDGPPPPVRKLAPDAPLELVAICEKAMARAIPDRYASAEAMAGDLRAYLDGRVVRAHRTGAMAELRAWTRRNRGTAASLTAAALALVAGTVVSLSYAGRAEESAANERAAAKLLEIKVGEFDQLAGVVLYERAIETAKTLYPAWPHQVAAMERWLKDDAGRLLSMRGQIEQAVQELRERALPATPEQIAHDKNSHPKFGEWQKQAARLLSLERAHAIRTKVQVLTLPLPTAEEQAMTASQLNTIAWPLVDFDETKRTWGEEAHALTLAKLAWDKTAGLPDTARYQLGDTLAWAWFANGKDDEARTQSGAALALAPAEEKAAYESYLATLQAKVQAASGEGGTKALVDLRALVSTLEAEVSARWTFAFADESQRFLHDTLSGLLAKLASLDGNERKAVNARLSWARQIGALTQNYPNTPSWSDARRAIATADGVVASELYRAQKIELRDQDVVGLVPIGMNPQTKLWEFYELASAWDGVRDPASLAIPRYVSKGDDHGYLDVGADTGIVFVLLPGGTFTMGTQGDDPNAPSYDPQRRDDEAMHEVTLAPFFLARHELTKGQWKRLSGGGEPSWYGIGKTYSGSPEAIGYAHPVEQVDWDMSVGLLGRHGMVLPTEAQWEYGCRGGTTTPWWTGSSAASLSGAANVLDKRAEASEPAWGRQEGDFDDGRVSLGPVAKYRANAFGLYDMHGNVWEWTRDGDHGAAAVPRIGDGLRGDPGPSSLRVNRGGSYNFAARHARSAPRARNPPTFRSSFLGLRPARASRLDD